MGGTAPGGVAVGYGVGGGDAVGVANNGLPHEMQYAFVGSFKAPQTGQAFEADKRTLSAGNRGPR